MQYLIKGTQLGYWKPSTRVQGHMIPDSDGEVCDRVYIIDQGEILREINLKEFRESGENLEEYFLSITNRVSQ